MRKVRELREAKGYSQRDMAHELNLSHPCIQRLENDESDPKWSTVEAAADFLGVTTDYLMGRDKGISQIKSRFSKGELDLIVKFLDDMRKLHTPEI